MRFVPLVFITFALLGLVACATPGGAMSPSAGGNPDNTSVPIQGAQTQMGQQGQAMETGSAITYANPNVYSFTLAGQANKITIRSTDDGDVIVAESNGAVLTEAQLAALLKSGSISISYGDNAITNTVSSGGGGAAGIEGGAGAAGGSRAGTTGGGSSGGP